MKNKSEPTEGRQYRVRHQIDKSASRGLNKQRHYVGWVVCVSHLTWKKDRIACRVASEEEARQVSLLLNTTPRLPGRPLYYALFWNTDSMFGDGDNED